MSVMKQKIVSFFIWLNHIFSIIVIIIIIIIIVIVIIVFIITEFS